MALTHAQFVKLMGTIKIPNGFKAELLMEQGWDKTKRAVYVLKTDTVEIKFDSAFSSGHTRFKSANGRWHTFDRIGVEDSFYFASLYKGDDNAYDVNAIVAEQLARIEKALAAAATAISIPGIPFTVQPARLAAMKEQLAAGKCITFTPSGFGTGYVISKQAPKWDARRAIRETESFFGVAPLYVRTMDCD